MALIDLDTAKKHLNITDTADDAEITGWLNAVDQAVEVYAGRDYTQKTLTEVVSGGRSSIVPNRAPVIEATEMAPFLGTTATYTTADLKTDGLLVYEADGRAFASGLYTLTYTVGVSAVDVPDRVKQAALIVLAHMWETQRGSMPSADEFGTPAVGMGYLIPNRAKELLGAPLPGIA